MSEVEGAKVWPGDWRSSGAVIAGVLLLADFAMVTHSQVVRDLAVATGLAIGAVFIVIDGIRLRDRRWKQELFVGTWAWIASTAGWLVVPYVANGARLTEQPAMLSSHEVPPGSWFGHAWALPVAAMPLLMTAFLALVVAFAAIGKEAAGAARRSLALIATIGVLGLPLLIQAFDWALD